MENKQNEDISLQDKRREVTHDESVLNPEKVHESDLSRRERRLLEKEKIKDMGVGRKLEYLWMYYKWVLFALIGAVFLVWAGMDWYENAKMETELAIAAVNAGQGDTETLCEEIKEMLGYEDEYSRVSIISNLTTEQDGKAFDYHAQVAYITQLQTKEIDVLVFPESLYESANIDHIFMDMKDVLDEKTLAAFGDMVKGDYLVVPNSMLDERMGIPYDPVCMAVPSNAEDIENASKWLASLVEQGGK